MSEGKWYLQYSKTMGVLGHDKTDKVELKAADLESAIDAGKTEWEKIKMHFFFLGHEVSKPEVIQSFVIEE